MNQHIETLKRMLLQPENNPASRTLNPQRCCASVRQAALTAAIADMERMEKIRELLSRFLSNPLVKDAVSYSDGLTWQYEDLIAAMKGEQQ